MHLHDIRRPRHGQRHRRRDLRRQRRQVRDRRQRAVRLRRDAANADRHRGPGDQSVALSWQAGGDVAPLASIQVTRSGGAKAASAHAVYSGNGTGFTDDQVENGVHYTYTITARDQAGNVAAQTIKATPGPRLLGPAPNAHLSAPPMLSWTAAPGATYYNVQLFRGTARC